jgi:hypothetical protein
MERGHHQYIPPEVINALAASAATSPVLRGVVVGMPANSPAPSSQSIPAPSSQSIASVSSGRFLPPEPKIDMKFAAPSAEGNESDSDDKRKKRCLSECLQLLFFVHFFMESLFRQQANRDSARECRKRKKEHITNLEVILRLCSLFAPFLFVKLGSVAVALYSN